MIPFSTLGERLDFLVRMIVPYSVMGLFFVLNIISLPHPFNGAVQIPFIVISIYYWAIYRPTLIPAGVILVTGLLFDVLTGAPIGLNGLLFLTIYWVVADQRRFLTAQSFVMIWLGFGVLYAVVLVIYWFAFSILQWHWPSLVLNVTPWLLGVISFPFMSVFLYLSHKILPEPNMPLTQQSRSKEFTGLE